VTRIYPHHDPSAHETGRSGLERRGQGWVIGFSTPSHPVARTRKAQAFQFVNWIVFARQLTRTEMRKTRHARAPAERILFDPQNQWFGEIGSRPLFCSRCAGLLPRAENIPPITPVGLAMILDGGIRDRRSQQICAPRTWGVAGG